MSDDLTQRLVKCPGWKWVRGLLMRTHEGDVCDVSYVSESGAPVHESYTEDEGWAKIVGAIPVAADPLLPGWVLRLVRDAWSAPNAHTMPWLSGSAWDVRLDRHLCDDTGFSGVTELDALVTALAAAPVKA